MDDQLRPRLRALLQGLARQRRTIAYRELAALAQVPPPQSIHKLTQALEELLREDQAAGRPILAALAVSRTGPGLPGRGFFELLAALGCYAGPALGPEAAAWHAAELQRVWAHWGDAPESGEPDLGP